MLTFLKERLPLIIPAFGLVMCFVALLLTVRFFLSGANLEFLLKNKQDLNDMKTNIAEWKSHCSYTRVNSIISNNAVGRNKMGGVRASLFSIGIAQGCGKSKFWGRVCAASVWEEGAS